MRLGAADGSWILREMRAPPLSPQTGSGPPVAWTRRIGPEPRQQADVLDRNS